MERRTVSSAATTGFDNASAYDVHRPSYPPQIVEALLGHLDVANKPRARIIDLAAGTGKFTELLAARDESFEVVAVEPVGKMRETLAGKKLRGVEIRDGLADSMNVADGWADAVVAAQSFHWYVSALSHLEAREKLSLIQSQVCQRGRTERDSSGVEARREPQVDSIDRQADNQPLNWVASTRWEDALKRIILPLKPDGTPRFRDDKWWEVFERQSRAAEAYFSTPIGQEKVPFAVWRTKDLLWDRVNTLSQVAILSKEDKAEFKAKFDDILKGNDQVWNDKGEVEFHGYLVYGWTTRL
ncbi:Methyltransferase type 11 [Moelleriella libera RCEF 2490]|uniref:Methyltransferase type 11 n=1 Tax=Moelleriella libera RCEF 2490 TaxID=1081109 RepID=A0A168B3D0_9HYPO|nr:Methyltransferase type 11 [Moelleriella libera RCEF 2490]